MDEVGRRSTIENVLLDLSEHFADLDDQEDAPLGEYARVSRDLDNNTLTVLHESEPWGFEIKLTPIVAQQ